MTNFEKLVRWDADYYKSLTDDDCIVCLTEREIYLLEQVIEPIRWQNTRWTGDTSGLDFNLITSDLAYKLSERMTCQNITKLLEKLQSLENKIDYVFEQTVINEGDILPDEDTPAWDVTTPEEFAEEFTFATDACDDPAKDSLYAGIYQLVRYINQVNIDALQSLAQIGNLAQQVDKLISAATGGLTPLDEVAAYVNFLVDELLDEYEATVDEELLETVTCDLFCIAVSSNCSLNLSDVINYYGSKIGSTVIDLTSSLANVMQFAATGTFSGDEYFYFMTTFQFITVALTDHFFGVDSMTNYMTQLAAGANSPDNDWTLLCDECPTLYRRKIWNFAYGQSDVIITTGFDLVRGEFIGNGFGLTQAGAPEDGLMTVGVPLDSTWVVRAVAFKFANKAAGDGGLTNVVVRITSGSNTGADGLSMSWGTTGWTYYSNFVTPSSITGYLELALRYADQLADDVYLSHVAMIFDVNEAPIDAVITEVNTFSGTVFP
jgi:hypothetical protein